MMKIIHNKNKVTVLVTLLNIRKNYIELQILYMRWSLIELVKHRTNVRVLPFELVQQGPPKSAPSLHLNEIHSPAKQSLNLEIPARKPRKDFFLLLQQIMTNLINDSE